MKVDTKGKPRFFRVGLGRDIEIAHQADITLDTNEQVTFVTNTGAEFDFVRKDWGYYATPSINKRLKSFGFQTALVQNATGHVFVFVVEPDKVAAFEEYCRIEEQTVLMWLDRIVCGDGHN